MPGKNALLQCKVCHKYAIRSDNMKRHMRRADHQYHVTIHEYLLDLPGKQLEKVLQAGHDIQQERDERRQRLVETVHDLELSASEEVHDPNSLNMDDLRELLLEDQQRYLKQIELGRNISYILDEGVIQEESLTLDNKLALDMYRQRRQLSVDVSFKRENLF